MVACLEMAKKVLKGIKADYQKVQEIERGVILEFTDSKTDRKYRVEIVEITEE